MQSPLLGFNNNVKHRGRLFHIQTEDSGIRHPHVITHLFMDGGRILKTIKTSYADHVGSDRLSERVRDLMKDQHKTMFIALRDGQFDHVFDGDDAPPPMVGGPASLLPNQFQPTPSRPPSAQMMAPKLTMPNRAPSDGAASVAPMVPVAPMAPVARPPQRREAPELFGNQAEDATAVVADDTSQGAAALKKAEPREKPGSGRYVASRPAAVFASGRHPEAGGSIFGDDLISEKSLDEVILSYLSEDLETSTSKK